MKCENCKSEFHSFEWYSILSQNDIVLCKECVIKVLEARISNYQSQINYTKTQINKLKGDKDMNYIKCNECKKNVEDYIMLNLNGVDFCPNCMAMYVCCNQNEIPNTNIFVDGKDKMILSKEMLINLVCKNLTKEQYFQLKEFYPNNWYLHDDFYDEEGNALQPME